MRLAWGLFLSSVVLLIAAACNGIAALEQGRWFMAAINGGFLLWNIVVISIENAIIDDLEAAHRSDL